MLHNIMIPKPQDRDALRFKVCRTLIIISPVLILVVMPTVQLHRKLFLRTIEIENIMANAVLPEEFHIAQLLGTHVLPDFLLCVSLVAPEFASTIFYRRVVEIIFHNFR